MAPTRPTEDYYAVLEIDQSADSNAVKSSYHRLARIRHPDKAKDNSTATADFQLLQQAYSTLIDVDQRRAYDRIYATIRNVNRTSRTAQQPKPSAAGSSAGTGSKPATSSTASENTRLANLKKSLADQTRLVAAEREKTQKLQTELRILREQVKRDKQSEASWGDYLASFVLWGQHETAEEKGKKERERLDREATIRIKQHRLDEQTLNLNIFQSRLHKIEEDIKTIQLAESRRKAQEVREEMRRQAEARAKEAAEEQARWQAEWLAQLERMRKEEAAARAREKQEKERAEAAESKRRRDNANRAKPTDRTARACQHRAFWARIEGRHDCSGCSLTTRKFAFRCPYCATVACATCREILKQGG